MRVSNPPASGASLSGFETAQSSTVGQQSVFKAIHPSVTNIDLALQGKGTGALIWGPPPDGTTLGGNARGQYAVDLQLNRDSAWMVASGDRSAAIGGSRGSSQGHNSAKLGGDNIHATGHQSFAIGGTGNIGQSVNGGVLSGSDNLVYGSQCVAIGGRSARFASNGAAYDTVIAGGWSNNGNSAFCCFVGGGYGNSMNGMYSGTVGGENNTNNGTRSFTGGGWYNNVSGSDAASVGGQNAAASGNGSVCLGGMYNASPGQRSLALGGDYNAANALNSVALGSYAKATHYAQVAMSGGRFASAGDTQFSIFQLRNVTTDGSSKLLLLDGSTATSRIVLTNGRSYFYEARVVATGSNGAACSFLLQGTVYNGTLGITPRITANTKTVWRDSNGTAPNWDVTVVASNNAGGAMAGSKTLDFSVVGISNVTVYWSATLFLNEVYQP